ncbi:PspC domain-containing protein [Corynebacterium afermentans]|uniref:PspC domain-containing protein n=1 Tax=Corynebacterium afermentans TaxID=38286 RepID=UPI0025741C24|nr:PspC domain-containing protein [Corynebacterium afermentans]MCG7292407.1 PspC domain-containing protein [Corynebacterium afermentans]
MWWAGGALLYESTVQPISVSITPGQIFRVADSCKICPGRGPPNTRKSAPTYVTIKPIASIAASRHLRTEFVLSQREKWHRVEEGKLIAGICAGVAETYGTSANTVRAICVIAGLCGAPMVIVYLLQWAIYPRY